jgi:Ca2+:H+ antiporter
MNPLVKDIRDNPLPWLLVFVPVVFIRASARMQAGLLFLATVALLIPSTIVHVDSPAQTVFSQELSLGLAVILIVTYGLGMLFSLKTHRDFLSSAKHSEASAEKPWPLGLALATLAVVTVLVSVVSEIFVESVQKAAEAFGMTPAFVGFIIVALVLVFVSYFVGPAPMDLQFWPGAVAMMLIATLTTSLVTSSGRSAWFVGVMVLMMYLIFAMTLYLLPPAGA